MNISFYIAKRYLISKKSHNAVNIISWVAICGVIVATMATVCTLSVFNGFQSLVSGMFSSFDPELKIVPVEGKVFDPATAQFIEVYSLPEIATVSESLEDNVLVRYRDKQVPAVIKGVSDNFGEQIRIEDILIDGKFMLKDEIHNYANPGIALANTLGINAAFIYPMEIYAPKRKAQVNLANPVSAFNSDYAYIGGVFMVNQPVYDENYMIVSIELAREMLDYENEVSSLEIKLKDGVDINGVQKNIRRILGENYQVKNRYEQQEEAFKMINIEKWVSFLVLCFILLIACFNVIGSITMLIVEKQADIVTLHNMGADNSLIFRIFLFEGWIIIFLGIVLGIVLGYLLCIGQQYFGWIKMGTEGFFSVDAYPVMIETGDLLMVLMSGLIIGFLIVLYPVRYFMKKNV
ncbi:MAG: ABC transporter permease [Dysgonamonadaceae bacterium]|nr:ABC transporter permease [Dysgonamonadaceae bacterium]